MTEYVTQNSMVMMTQHVTGNDDKTCYTVLYGNDDTTCYTELYGNDDRTCYTQLYGNDDTTCYTQLYGNDDTTCYTCRPVQRGEKGWRFTQKKHNMLHSREGGICNQQKSTNNHTVRWLDMCFVWLYLLFLFCVLVYFCIGHCWKAALLSWCNFPLIINHKSLLYSRNISDGASGSRKKVNRQSSSGIIHSHLITLFRPRRVLKTTWRIINKFLLKFKIIELSSMPHSLTRLIH